MKVFIAYFGGHYLAGQMIVVEETKRKAYNKAKKEIENMGLLKKNNDFSMENISEIDVNKKDVILIDNGDY